jgi:hypothetical protein
VAHRSERRQRALLVEPHQPGIADDIGAQDDGKPMLYSGIGHSLPASPQLSSHSKQRSPEDIRVKPLRAEFPYLIETGPDAAGRWIGGRRQTIMFSPSKVVISNPSKFSPA